jgi:hypothetical protein
VATTETLNTGLNVQTRAEAGAVMDRRKYIGMNVLRTEDPTFLTGKGRYTDDISLTGMVHAAFLRSSQPHARILGIDKTRALAIDGVIDVIVQSDLEGVIGPFSTTVARPEVETVTRAILNSTTALYVGQPIAIVVAESRYIAEDGVDALDVEWEVLDPIMDPEKALEADSPLLYPEMGTNNFAHIEFQRGDVKGAFERADHVFRKRFHAGRFMAAPLEARGVIADWEEAAGELTVWSSSQVPNLVRTYTAGPLGIPESKMRVISDGVGGGFGMKAHVFDEEVLIPAASKLVGRPVKWIEDRYENLAASLHSKEVIIYLEMAVQDDGTFLAFRGHYIGVGGAWPAHPWTSLIDPLPAASLLPSFYDIEAVETSIDAPMTNRCPLGAYRGVGWTPGHSARETMIDDIARELGIDPLEIRLKNTIPDSEPFVSVTGMKYDGGSYSGSMNRVKEMIDYDGLLKKQAELRREGRYIGIGWSPWVEPCAWGSEVAKANGFAAEFFDAASVTIDRGLRHGHVRQPHGRRRRRRDHARGQRGARQDHPPRRARDGGQPRGRRAGGRQGERQRRAGQSHDDAGARHAVLLRRAEPHPGRRAVADRDALLRPAGDVQQRHDRRDRRGRHRDRQGSPAAHRRVRGLRHDAEPDGDRRADAGRDRAGHRRRHVRGPRLRRERAVPRQLADGLPLPGDDGGPEHRDLPHRDPLDRHGGRHQGDGRVRHDLVPGRVPERDRRRDQPVRRHQDHEVADRPERHPGDDSQRSAGPAGQGGLRDRVLVSAGGREPPARPFGGEMPAVQTLAVGAR